MTESSADDWTTALPGLDLVHDMQFALQDMGAVARLAVSLVAAGAELQTLSLNRAAGALSARCRVRGLTPDAARDLLDALERAGCILAPTHVEHLMLTRAQGANP